jgi:hypothetical protein
MNQVFVLLYMESFLRFFRVEKLAQRTALVEEDGGSLLRYALSYLQSLFIISPSRYQSKEPIISKVPKSLNVLHVTMLKNGLAFWNICF